MEVKIMKFNEYILNESKGESFNSWFNENKEKLKKDYAEYKSDFKLDGGLPKEEMLSFKEWAKERYDAL